MVKLPGVASWEAPRRPEPWWRGTASMEWNLIMELVVPASIFVFNFAIFLFALIQRGRQPTQPFLLAMTAAVMAWAGGRFIFGYLDAPGLDYSVFPVYILPAITAMLAPAAFLTLALLYPRPLPWVERHKFPVVLLFLPPLLFISLTRGEFMKLAEGYSMYDWKIFYSWGKLFWDPETSVWTSQPLFGVSTLYLLTSAGIYNSRLKGELDPGERDVLRGTLSVLIGCVAFGVAWIVILPAERVVYPAPSMLLALAGEAAVVFVFRTMQEPAPDEIRRAILVPILALAIIAVILLGNFLLGLMLPGANAIFEGLQLQLLILVCVSASLVLFLFRDELLDQFDRIMFSRARMLRQMHIELRETRERLSRAERMAIVGQIAASVAHEIKNPLGPIKGYTEMMRTLLAELPASPQKEKIIRSVAIIAEEVDNINQRVGRLLEFSKSERFERKLCALDRILRRAAELARIEQLEFGAPEARFDFDKALPEIWGDPFRLNEAFFNIVQNAYQALPPSGGRIDIRTRRRDSGKGRPGVEIWVVDNGKGMTLEETKSMFKPFYTTREGGTGLGLGVVKNAILAHGGGITVTSDPGRGTTVSVWLPAAAEAGAAAPAPTALRAAGAFASPGPGGPGLREIRSGGGAE